MADRRQELGHKRVAGRRLGVDHRLVVDHRLEVSRKLVEADRRRGADRMLAEAGHIKLGHRELEPILALAGIHRQLVPAAGPYL